MIQESKMNRKIPAISENEHRQKRTFAAWKRDEKATTSYIDYEKTRAAKDLLWFIRDNKNDYSFGPIHELFSLFDYLEAFDSENLQPSDEGEDALMEWKERRIKTQQDLDILQNIILHYESEGPLGFPDMITDIVRYFPENPRDTYQSKPLLLSECRRYLQIPRYLQQRWAPEKKVLKPNTETGDWFITSISLHKTNENSITD